MKRIRVASLQYMIRPVDSFEQFAAQTEQADGAANLAAFPLAGERDGRRQHQDRDRQHCPADEPLVHVRLPSAARPNRMVACAGPRQ